MFDYRIIDEFLVKVENIRFCKEDIEIFNMLFDRFRVLFFILLCCVMMW